MKDPTALRDEIRAYLRAHKKPQKTLAAELGVSHSWLNKFVIGHIDSPRIDRLSSLARWVAADRSAKSGADSN